MATLWDIKVANSVNSVNSRKDGFYSAIWLWQHHRIYIKMANSQLPVVATLWDIRRLKVSYLVEATLWDTKMAKNQLPGCGNTEVIRVANISQRSSGKIKENIRLAIFRYLSSVW